MASPLSRPIRQQTIEQVDAVCRRHGLDDRTGGANSRARVRDRLAKLPDLATHDGSDAVEAACEGLARAVLLVERVQAEHDDASAGDMALTRARVLLIEAAALIETLAHVDPHGDKIRALRGEPPRHASPGKPGPVNPEPDARDP